MKFKRSPTGKYTLRARRQQGQEWYEMTPTTFNDAVDSLLDCQQDGDEVILYTVEEMKDMPPL